MLTSELRAGLTVFPRGNSASVTSPKSTFDILNLQHAVEPTASLPAEGLTPLHLTTMQVLTLLNMPRGRKLKFKTSQDLGVILGFSSKEVPDGHILEESFSVTPSLEFDRSRASNAETVEQLQDCETKLKPRGSPIAV